MTFIGDEVMFSGLSAGQVSIVEAWLTVVPNQSWRGGLLRMLKATLSGGGSPPWSNAVVLAALFSVFQAQSINAPILPLS